MAIISASAGTRQASVSAVLTKADGRVIDLGTIAYYHPNPLRMLAWRIGRLWRMLHG